MRKRLILLLSGTGLLLVALIGTLIAVNRLSIPGDRPTDKYPSYFVIDKGMPFSAVARALATEGYIRSPLLFRLKGRISGLDKKLQAGRFYLRHPMPLDSLLDFFSSGGSFAIDVTVPEGFTVAQIAQLLKDSLGVDSTAFEVAASDSQLLRKNGFDATYAEGYLFPDTYRLEFATPPTKIVEMMLKLFHQKFPDSLVAEAAKKGFDLRGLVILASIVEAEAKLKSEQPTIASVYSNRLRIDMKLEADPTVIYGLPGRKRPLTLDDLRTDHPYNTYLHKGLMPGPICSPGYTALLAALRPATTDFLFFVARGDGSHIFTHTFEEHCQAIHKIRGGKS